MSEDLTIKIKKENVWKYSTFILAAIVIVGIIWMVVGSNNAPAANNANNNNANAANNQQAQGNTAAKTLDVSLFSDTTLYPALGPKTAKTTVVEFADFQCPYCALAAGLANWTAPLASKYGDFVGVASNAETAAEQNKIRFIYVPMAFLGTESTYAAEAALCANQQGKFWEMHDAIFTAHDSQENNGKFNKDKLEIIAKSVSGLDQTKFKTCLESDATLSDVQTLTQAANAQGISATPTFFMNGQQINPSWATIQAQIQ